MKSTPAIICAALSNLAINFDFEKRRQLAGRRTFLNGQGSLDGNGLARIVEGRAVLTIHLRSVPANKPSSRGAHWARGWHPSFLPGFAVVLWLVILWRHGTYLYGNNVTWLSVARRRFASGGRILWWGSQGPLWRPRARHAAYPRASPRNISCNRSWLPLQRPVTQLSTREKMKKSQYNKLAFSSLLIHARRTHTSDPND